MKEIEISNLNFDEFKEGDRTMKRVFVECLLGQNSEIMVLGKSFFIDFVENENFKKFIYEEKQNKVQNNDRGV